MNKKEKSILLFKSGYNCAQAVLGAFCDDFGLDNDTAMRLSSSFGGGMGRMREVCGAVSGMCMVLGLAHGYTLESSREEKGAHYALIRDAAEQFRSQNGSIICRELLGTESKPASAMPDKRDTAYYSKRPCAEMVGCAAEITENLLKKLKNKHHPV